MVCYVLFGLSFTSMAESKVFEPSNLFENLKSGDKVAILMVHFGTTHADTRALTIDALNAKVQEHFKGVEVREAYTSRIVAKRLKDQGITKLNPTQALDALRRDGYTHILIQPTTIIDGVEMESLTETVRAEAARFKEVRLGTPLLFYTEDYARVIEVLAEGSNPGVAYLWVGHGTYDVSTAQYSMLDYMLTEKGYTNHIVGCIEGYPYYEQALGRLKALGIKQVRLAPLMFVAGEHAKHDIAEDWREKLEAEGFAVEVSMQGLGEIPAIQDCYVNLLEFHSKNRRLGILEKKKQYEVTGQKME